MSNSEFSFNSSKVAETYDNVLVPILFTPWAEQLIDDNQPWTGKTVLDLATGTGVVARLLAEAVGIEGAVYAIDISPEMLQLAQKRCEGLIPASNFIESSASPLTLDDQMFDFVVCQQGFQFFTDKKKCADEIYRVLRPSGRVVCTTWCTVDECEFFGEICTALDIIGESSLTEKMKIPFNNMPGEELKCYFEETGFKSVTLSKQHKDFVLEGGINAALELAYATPIGPDLVELSQEKQAHFKTEFAVLLERLSPDGTTMGLMVTHCLSAEK